MFSAEYLENILKYKYENNNYPKFLLPKDKHC